jgi:hypothetical protein
VAATVPLAAEKRPDAVTLRTLMSVARQIRLLAVDRSSYVRVAVDINTPFTVTLAFMVVTPDIVKKFRTLMSEVDVRGILFVAQKSTS